jgi:hypothetical protein
VSPIVAGAKLVAKVVVCPAANVNGSDGVLTLKPVPETAAWVIVKVSLLEFVTVNLWLLVAPIATLPKLRFAGLMAKFPGAVHPE